MFKSSLISVLLFSSSSFPKPQDNNNIDYDQNLNDYDPDSDPPDLQDDALQILQKINGNDQNNNPDLQNVLSPPTEFIYHNYDMLTRLISNLATNNPNLVRTYTLGKSQEGRELWAIQLTNLETLNSDKLRPHVKIVGNMHGDESISRELGIQLAESLVLSYKNGNSRIQKLLNELDIHIVPSANPDGFEASTVSCNPNSNKLGRQVKGNIDPNRDFPDPFLNADWKPELDDSGNVINWNNHHAQDDSLNLKLLPQTNSKKFHEVYKTGVSWFLNKVQNACFYIEDNQEVETTKSEKSESSHFFGKQSSSSKQVENKVIDFDEA